MEVGRRSGDEKEEDKARESETKNQTNETTDAMKDEPENGSRRFYRAVAGGIQLGRSSEAVGPAVEIVLLQRRELHNAGVPKRPPSQKGSIEYNGER